MKDRRQRDKETDRQRQKKTDRVGWVGGGGGGGGSGCVDLARVNARWSSSSSAFPARSLGFIFSGEIFVYVTVFLIPK